MLRNTLMGLLEMQRPIQGRLMSPEQLVRLLRRSLAAQVVEMAPRGTVAHKPPLVPWRRPGEADLLGARILSPNLLDPARVVDATPAGRQEMSR